MTNKKVIIVHGWEGHPENCWFPWLKNELIKRDFEVIIPKMPNSEKPEIESWCNFLKENTGEIDGDTYFVGHSIGCQTIMRLLETFEEDKKVGGLIFVAGFFNLPFLETNEEKEIAKPWLEIPINTDKIKLIAKNIIAIFSDDDQDVSIDDSKLFKEKLNAKIIIEHNKGHFSDDEGIKELLIVLKEILEIQNK